MFTVAPYGGVPLVYQYIKRKLAPDDMDYVRVLTVKQLANFLKSQVAVANSYKKSKITKRFRELLGYPIHFAVEGFQKDLFSKQSKKGKK
ncbi:hypothetical protein ACQ4M3_42110 [Leptolyngbya sp. AN03gr2]|uniref:hypothetical protein n=1 Tax=unclassified Leptolyngbya TaxID=2650499 RepID=UPI003D32162B